MGSVIIDMSRNESFGEGVVSSQVERARNPKDREFFRKLTPRWFLHARCRGRKRWAESLCPPTQTQQCSQSAVEAVGGSFLLGV